MTTDMLRCALRGVAAYRPVVDEPVMRLALGYWISCPPGTAAGPWRTTPGCSMPCGARGAGAWGNGWTAGSGTGNPPMPLWWSGAGRTPPWRPPGGY